MSNLNQLIDRLKYFALVADEQTTKAHGDFHREIVAQLILLEQQRDELFAAAKQTLDENGHLADGDNCTLKVLRDAVEKVEAAK